MIRSNPWRLGNSSSRAPTLRPGPTHWQAWSHRHWQSESGTATWQWQCTQAATGSVRVPGTLPLATRSWPCDVQVRRCIQTSSRSPVPRRLRHGRTRRQARSTCATKRICPEKCSHTGNTRGHRVSPVGQNFHPAAPGLGRFFPGGGIGGRPALSTAVRTRVLVAWSMEWREPLMNYGPCSIMEAGLAWGTCTIRFHNQAKVGTWWFGQQ